MVFDGGFDLLKILGGAATVRVPKYIFNKIFCASTNMAGIFNEIDYNKFNDF